MFKTLSNNMKRIFCLCAHYMLALPRTVKKITVITVDIFLCFVSTWFAFYLRFENPSISASTLLPPTVLAITFVLPIFSANGLYQAIFRYSGRAAIISIARALLIYSVVFFTVLTSLGLKNTPLTIGILQPMVLFLTVVTSRLLARLLFEEIFVTKMSNYPKSRVTIYGAGSAGRQLAHALGRSEKFKLVGFFDDNKKLYGQLLEGFPIFPVSHLPDLVNSEKVTHVILALPSISRARRNAILKLIKCHRVIVHSIPSLNDLVEGRVSFNDIRELNIDDLLGRDSVTPNTTLLEKNIFEKTILVTGAGGSIGSELCRQILRLNPENLLLVDFSEYSLFRIHCELEDLSETLEVKAKCNIIPLLTSVLNENRMREILKIWQPDTIYHAAAYKHVPLVEQNLAEGIKNNVLGTLTMALLAIERNVTNFILISTDKAVRPTNAMGASKRVAELCIQALFHRASCGEVISSKLLMDGSVHTKQIATKLSMVRFGNVLGSSGSVIPKFRAQIQSGGPITLTHPDITRYFMTIPEAAQLVIQASALANGGEVFVLDMGEPVKIADLAKSMVELSGLQVRDNKNPGGDIELSIIGLRPGEKLYEELFLGDVPEPTSHPKIRRASDAFISWDELESSLEKLHDYLDDNRVPEAILVLQDLVSGYAPSKAIVDWFHVNQTSNYPRS